MSERKRRPYQLKNPELRHMVDQLTAEAEAVYGQMEESELLRQMLTTSVRFVRDHVNRGDFRLVNNALKWRNNQDCTDIRIWVHPGNTEAIRFYWRFGFATGPTMNRVANQSLHRTPRVL